MLTPLQPARLWLILFLGCQLASPSSVSAQSLDWGAPAVTVTNHNEIWTLSGTTNSVSFNQTTLAMSIHNGPVDWSLTPSLPGDLVVQTGHRWSHLRLSDAHKIIVTPYCTGFKTGIKIRLNQWSAGFFRPAVNLPLCLTIGLEGRNQELVCDVAADESHGSNLRQLDWPPALDARDVDDTVLSNNKGNLLPRNWPKPYYPIRSTDPNMGTAKPNDHSLIQSHVIEDWSMSWWGFEKGPSAMMLICETPDDAAYQFSHPAGGPTVIGPRWLSSLGRFAYRRSVRFCFFPRGNYVTLAKRYRQYVMDSGLFVSLDEKIARTPSVAGMIGLPQTRIGILHNQSTNSDRYSSTNHYELFTFDQRATQLKALKAAGIDQTLVFISGWAHLGYDRQHPDPLPPPEAAGGWDGLKRLTDTCHELNYPFIFHDQYRDYYTDAPSFNVEFAIHEETTKPPAIAFAGSRFGDWKEGQIPYMRHWDGGPQSYLNSRYQLGHLQKNYQLMFDHQIHPDGIYIDVIGYVPPDEDFNPEHPTTRTEAMRGQADLMNWSARHLGFTATEAGSDWVIPFTDSVNQSGGLGRTIPVPLYQLVYHDAVLVSYGEARRGGHNQLLLGCLCGGVPELPVDLKNVSDESLMLMKKMAALNRRVGRLEMTDHEFLDSSHQRERTTFADGTTVTVDWTANSVAINPPLE